MSDTQNIQWFPGHMTRTFRRIKEKLPLVDAVAEIVDARIPVSSRNPDLDAMLGKKPRIIIFNKVDIADDKANAEWLNYYKSNSALALPVNCKNGLGMSAVIPAFNELLRETIEKNKARGLTGKTLRIMAVGIPNVGKSTFINRLAGSNRAKVEDRPGVTRGDQWFVVGKGIELLDTPGALWPKFEDPKVGERLAFTGAIKDQVVDIEALAFNLTKFMLVNYPENLKKRYSIEIDDSDPLAVMDAVGKRRGAIMRGGDIDYERVAIILLDEFRAGKLGRITLEFPD